MSNAKPFRASLREKLSSNTSTISDSGILGAIGGNFSREKFQKWFVSALFRLLGGISLLSLIKKRRREVGINFEPNFAFFSSVPDNEEAEAILCQ
jgi:hypothetical protein